MGYAFTLGHGVVSWSSKRQPTVALPTTEAEYMAAAHAVKEALWLRKLLAEFHLKTEIVEIFCDNQSAIKLLKKGCHHAPQLTVVAPIGALRSDRVKFIEQENPRLGSGSLENRREILRCVTEKRRDDRRKVHDRETTPEFVRQRLGCR